MTYRVTVTIDFDPVATVEAVHKIRDDHQKALQALNTGLTREQLRGWSIKHELEFDEKEFKQ